MIDAGLLPALLSLLTIARTGSVGAAARLHHRTSSAISQQVRALVNAGDYHYRAHFVTIHRPDLTHEIQAIADLGLQVDDERGDRGFLRHDQCAPRVLGMDLGNT